MIFDKEELNEAFFVTKRHFCTNNSTPVYQSRCDWTNLQKHRAIHRERRWRCWRSQCGRCGWSLDGNCPDSTPATLHFSREDRETDLDEFVPASGNDDGVAGRGREADSRHPVSVAVFLKIKQLTAKWYTEWPMPRIRNHLCKHYNFSLFYYETKDRNLRGNSIHLIRDAVAFIHVVSTDCRRKTYTSTLEASEAQYYFSVHFILVFDQNIISKCDQEVLVWCPRLLAAYIKAVLSANLNANEFVTKFV